MVDSLTNTPAREALQLARTTGLLDVESLVRRHDDEQHLREIREHLDEGTWSDGVGLDGAAEILMSRLMGLLTRSRSLPLLDDAMGDLARSGIEGGLFVPGSSAGKRTAQAGSATGFLERLPTFPAATMDEVLDIRSELRSPLTHFRAEVVKLSADMAQTALERDFAAEVDAQWHGTVAPALQEIREAVEQNTYLRRLRDEVTGSRRVVEGATGLGGGGVLGVMMGSTSATAFAVAAASMGLGAALQAQETKRATDAETRSSGFWFLHEVDQRLR